MAERSKPRSPGLNGWRVAGWSGLAALLALPAIAMQLTHEVAWEGTDFLIMGAMLLALGLAVECIARFAKTPGRRAAAIGIALLVFLLVWAELAVGIIGSPIAGS